jgi:Fe-S-cluster containining protein
MEDKQASDQSAPSAGGGGHMVVEIDGARFEFDLSLPDIPLNADDMVGVLQVLQGAIADQAEQRVAAAGKPVSCRAGCGACCRQSVPVTEPEARALAALVEAMPEPRRTQVIARFAAAQQRLRSSPVGQEMIDRHARGQPVPQATIDAYFFLGIACPFLEEESCSIHPMRPIVCREYLVTSDPSHCAALDGERIRRVPLTPLFPRAVAASRRDTHKGWLLLIDALDFAAATSPGPRTRTGPEILRAVLETPPPA